MPLIIGPPPPPSYDRDDVVREVTAFYAFLIKMYLSASLLRIPPPEGWSSITTETYAWLKKTPTVIDLMRHLPYISREEAQSGAYEIFPFTAAVDYEGVQVRRAMRFAGEYPNRNVDLFAIEPDPSTFPDYTSIPEYMLVLATETSGGDGYWWFLDTQRGTMTLYDGGRMDSPVKEKGTVDNDPIQEGVNDSETWREHPTCRVAEFFEMLKEHYTELKLIPQSNDVVAPGSPGDMDDAQIKIYKDCGWPDLTTYRKDECIARIEKMMDEYRRTKEIPRV